ncbi:hypothetical protein RirG_030670 [Rhizophagus irregularis DAOM 197198w]|nr:hypothetical protein RirG_030670 [Rhizophagus irregularis DAOM 197198w]
MDSYNSNNTNNTNGTNGTNGTGNVNNNELSVIVERLKSSDEKDLNDPDCKISEVEVSSGDFLLKFPRGAYTSARTVKRKSIMDLQSHVSRMVHSLRLMKFIPESEVPTEKSQDNKENNEFEAEESSQITRELIPYRKSDTFKQLIIPILRKGLSRYCEIKGLPSHNNKREYEDEIKVTILVCYSFKEKRPILVAHFINLYSLNTSRCKVEIYGEPRKSAEAKDSQWVRDRKSLESILYNPDKQEPLVVTAPIHHVLEGTILKIVRMICERDKIDFQYWFPNANDAEQWKGAFITSTSRLVLPIELIKFRNGRPLVKLPPHNNTIEHIKNEVEKEIFHRAYRIL